MATLGLPPDFETALASSPAICRSHREKLKNEPYCAVRMIWVSLVGARLRYSSRVLGPLQLLGAKRGSLVGFSWPLVNRPGQFFVRLRFLVRPARLDRSEGR